MKIRILSTSILRTVYKLLLKLIQSKKIRNLRSLIISSCSFHLLSNKVPGQGMFLKAIKNAEFSLVDIIMTILEKQNKSVCGHLYKEKIELSRGSSTNHVGFEH